MNYEEKARKLSKIPLELLDAPDIGGYIIYLEDGTLCCGTTPEVAWRDAEYELSKLRDYDKIAGIE